MMDAPFFKYGLFGDDFSLVAALFIGLGFGFFLERAGFGSGRKLAAQFYFKDMAVLKVMFSAIVTAMVGVFWLSRVGFLDLSQVYLVPTKVGPIVLGASLLGVGFVVGGYCPGTSVVAIATGRIDAMLYGLGMFFGMVVVGFLWPSLEGFMGQPGLGQVTLSTVWGIPYGVLVAAVVLMAAGAFLAAEWGEVKSGGRSKEEQSLLFAKGFNPARKFVVGFVAVGLVAAVAGNPYRGTHLSVDGNEIAQSLGRGTDHVTPVLLADRLIAGRNELRVVDLRSPEEYARYHIPGAENVPVGAVAATTWSPADSLLLYAEDSEHPAQVWTYLKARRIPHVYTLEGGLKAWKDDILFPQLGNPADEAARQAEEKRRQVALHFGGAVRGAPVEGAAAVEMPAPAALPMPVAPPAGAPAGAAPGKKPKKEGC